MFNLFINIGRIGGEGLGPFAKEALGFAEAVGKLQDIISRVIAVMTIAGGIWFIFQFIVGAYGWITSGGNKESLKNAQDRIVHAITGLVILVAAYALISIFGSLLGLPILNPWETLSKIGQ